ncbi:MAG: hypothetical protein ACRDSJ_20675 [Rubrobacteraceae bacterium]
MANTLYYPRGGGHRWVYLNWALGLKALGCEVIWLEGASPNTPAHKTREFVAALKDDLRPYGLSDCVALCSWDSEPMPEGAADNSLTLDDAACAELLLNLRYDLRPGIVARFRRTALVDIDPGLLQLWMAAGHVRVAPHDVYFTTSEAVGKYGSRIPDGGIEWRHVPPCVALEWWPEHEAAEGASWTTVSHWGTRDDWVKEGDTLYYNDKKVGFEPFLDLPRHTTQPMELALCLAETQHGEWFELEQRGWHIRHSFTVASTPAEYQKYIQHSLGEFSCTKPSCVRLRNAWVSDRTLCYLASGKPAVVQHTGESEFLPDQSGLFRFRTLEEAAAALEKAASDYERQCKLARALVEEHFDAKKVVTKVLERALA